MQKFRCLWWYGIIGAITGVAIFLMSSMRLFAEGAGGEEVYFTHTHSDSCYKSVTGSCENKHICTRGYEEYKTFHCTTCGTMMNHKIVSDSWYCPVKKQYWQVDAIVTCTVCGSVYSTWSNYYPSLHVVTNKELICGLTEGEKTLGICIIADTHPTNTDVTLRVSQNVIKEDSQNGMISFDWGGDTCSVTENGTYSVTAVNGAGQSVTTTVTIGCIDKTVPVIHSVTHDASSVTQNSVTVSVSASDGESGLADSAYSTDGGTTWSAQSTFTVSEGIDVQLVVRDKAGNTATQVIKRSTFPYPPKPTPAPTPVPTPKPVVTPAPTQNPETQSATSTDNISDNIDKTTQEVSEDTTTVNNENNVENNDFDGKGDVEEDSQGKDIRNNKDTEYKEESHDAGTNAKPEQEELEAIEVAEEVPMVAKPLLGDDSKGDNNGIGNVVQTGDAGTIVTYNEKNPVAVSENGAGQGILHHINGTGGGGSVENNGLHNITVQRVLSVIGTILAVVLVTVLVLGGVRFFWMNSAVLYIYDGGDAYKKLGLFILRKNEEDMELYLPEYLTESTDILRYRLLLKNALVKKFAGKDLVVCSEDTRLRRPMEECVDFVL